MNQCLIDKLKVLKESSKEAVENVNSFNQYKDYMHVQRNVEHDLLQCIQQAAGSARQRLILVCGSVGDGKSHLISYMKKHHKALVDQFYIHNDATESFEPTKTSEETLDDILGNAFSDEALNQVVDKKVILAINLGTLSNFIESPHLGDRYKNLQKFVQDYGILDRTIADRSNTNNGDSIFSYVNFSDYQIFELTEEGPQSEYIRGILYRITSPDNQNQFYSTYCESCLSCQCANSCPVKLNFELLSKPFAQERIEQLLIEAIIKFKLLISTRALLNFCYDIIVSNVLDTIPSERLKKHISTMSFEQSISLLLPNLIFEHADLSTVFEKLEKLDPAGTRSEDNDRLVVELSITRNIAQIFEQYIRIEDYPQLKLELYVTGTMLESDNIKERDELIKLFFRLRMFSPKDHQFLQTDHVYLNYMTHLFYFNNGDRPKLKSFCSDIKNAIYQWNGDSDDGWINIFIGRNQQNYKVSQKLEIINVFEQLSSKKQSRIDKMTTNFLLGYRVNGHETTQSVDIDFALYALLMDIIKGYRPNRKDKVNFIGFVSFLENIQRRGKQATEVVIEDRVSANRHGRHKLVYDEEFGTYSFERI